MANDIGTIAMATGAVIVASDIADFISSSKSDVDKYGRETLGFVTYILGLSFLNGMTPDIANKIASLVLVTMLLLRIPPVLTAVRTNMSSAKQQKATPGSSGKSGMSGGSAGGGVSGNGGGAW